MMWRIPDMNMASRPMSLITSLNSPSIKGLLGLARLKLLWLHSPLSNKKKIFNETSHKCWLCFLTPICYISLLDLRSQVGMQCSCQHSCWSIQYLLLDQIPFLNTAWLNQVSLSCQWVNGCQSYMSTGYGRGNQHGVDHTAIKSMPGFLCVSHTWCT